MKAVRRITDTTLYYFHKRMQPEDRILWAGRLNDTGIHEIVMPYTSRKGLDACGAAITNARQAVYIRLDPALLAKALRAGMQTIHLEIPASYPMIYTVYRKNKDWVRKTLLECKDLLHCADVQATVVLADASRAEPCFLETLVQLMAGMQIEKIIAKDITGIQTLSACGDMIAAMRDFGYPLGYECGDQFGMAVANTIQALRMGAMYASCCLGGVGGGCDLRRLLQTTNRVFHYGTDRKGVEQLDRAFKQQYRSERMLQRQNGGFADCRLR